MTFAYSNNLVIKLVTSISFHQPPLLPHIPLDDITSHQHLLAFVTIQWVLWHMDLCGDDCDCLYWKCPLYSVIPVPNPNGIRSGLYFASIWLLFNLSSIVWCSSNANLFIRIGIIFIVIISSQITITTITIYHHILVSTIESNWTVHVTDFVIKIIEQLLLLLLRYLSTATIIIGGTWQYPLVRTAHIWFAERMIRIG